MTFISLAGISRVYSRPEGEVRAIDAITLEIGRGELISVTGPSGSGKSTLLHILGLLDTPTAGAYHLDSEDVSGLQDGERSARRNHKIGFVFQAFQLVPHLSIAANVELPLVYRGMPSWQRAELTSQALAHVGLAHRSRHLPDELSGGEQQRAAIARALVQEPALLLADEPTGNLDPASTDGVLELFLEIHRAGTTVVMVTHNPRVSRVASRGYELHDGRLVG